MLLLKNESLKGVQGKTSIHKLSKSLESMIHWKKYAVKKGLVDSLLYKTSLTNNRANNKQKASKR